MVRPFPRKSDRQGSHSSGHDERWFETSSSNETSPASFWGLDEEVSFRSQAKNSTSGNAHQGASLDTVKWYDHPDYQQPFRNPGSQPRNRDPHWWAQPNLMEEEEELTKTESSADEAEIPTFNEPEIGPEFDAMTVEDDLDEDTLITQPVTVTTIPEPETSDEPQQLVSVEQTEARTIPEPEISDEPQQLVSVEQTVATTITEPETFDEPKQLVSVEQTEATTISEPETFDEPQQLVPVEQTEAIEEEIFTEPEKKQAIPIRVLDESAELPSEASFARLRLAEPVKRPRVLDESSILPSEASYATVTLNQPKNQPEKQRSRVLDESTVLPGEASFATVPLYQTLGAGSYSPRSEFVHKAASGLRRSFPILLLVAVCTAVVVFSVKYKDTLGISGAVSESQTSHSLSAEPQVKPVTKTETQVTPSSSIAVSTNPTETVQHENQTAPAATRVAPAPKPETPVAPAPKPENPVAPVPKPENPVAPTPTPEATIVADSQKRTSSDAAREVDKPAVTKRKAEPAKNASVAADTRREKPAAAPAVPEVKKVAEQSQPVSSGGGERPRRVKPPGDSQGTSTAKPKVIDWP